ncbi:MAG: hypothetical protein MR436_13885, partial [Eubacterium sp.]|nr:hypothetical protein [Eubacterium sp.]
QHRKAALGLTIPHYLISGKQANQRVSILRNVGFQNSGIKVSGDENIQQSAFNRIVEIIKVRNG